MKYSRQVMIRKVSDKGQKWHAFTLLECLCALGILAFLCALFLPLVQNQRRLDENAKDQTQLNWHIFLLQVSYLNRDVYLQKASSHQLELYQPKAKYPVIYLEKYSKQGDSMLRFRQGNGHEPLLLDVDQFQLSANQGNVRIWVRFKNQKEYSGAWQFKLKDELDEE